MLNFVKFIFIYFNLLSVLFTNFLGEIFLRRKFHSCNKYLLEDLLCAGHHSRH